MQVTKIGKEVLKGKKLYFDGVAADWRSRYNLKGPDVLAFLEEQWKFCQMAPDIFKFIPKTPSETRENNNKRFLEE